MDKLVFVVLACLLATLMPALATRSESSEDEDDKRPNVEPPKDQLTRGLLKWYQNAVDPGKTNLTLGLNIQCATYDEATNIATLNVWEYLEWQDTRLVWTPEDFDGITTLRIPAKLLWTPDTRIFTQVSMMERDLETNAVVVSDGTVLWVPPAIYKSRCSQDSNGTATCNIKIGSWTYDGYNVALKTRQPAAVELDFYNEVCQWVVTSQTSTITDNFYPCCPEPYPSFNIVLTLDRRSA